jgi:hypothetical protein
MKFRPVFSIMKVSFIILSFVVILGIVTGCMGTKDTSGAIDPVVGSWESDNFKMTFFENGKGEYGGFLGGDWEKNNETYYVFSGYGADAPAGAYTATIVFIYDPRFDTLSTTGGKLFYRVLDTRSMISR